jgi:hypothetical protein
VFVGFADVQQLYSPYPNAVFNIRYICDVGQLLTDVRPNAVNDTDVVGIYTHAIVLVVQLNHKSLYFGCIGDSSSRKVLVVATAVLGSPV